MSWTERDKRFMNAALQEARLAQDAQEVPVGVVFVQGDTIVARGSNQTNITRNGTRHAELVAVDALLAEHNGNESAAALHECEVYVTCEPCIMCAGALSLLRVRRVVYGCPNDKFGGAGSVWNVAEEGCGSCGRQQGAPVGFSCEGGLFEDEAVALLRDFYESGNPIAPRPHRPVPKT